MRGMLRYLSKNVHHSDRAMGPLNFCQRFKKKKKKKLLKKGHMKFTISMLLKFGINIEYMYD